MCFIEILKGQNVNAQQVVVILKLYLKKLFQMGKQSLHSVESSLGRESKRKRGHPCRRESNKYRSQREDKFIGTMTRNIHKTK